MNFIFLKNTFLFISFILIFMFIILGLLQPVNLDVDLGRHLLFGKIMLQNGEVIKTNLLSYTHANFEYINSHWFSEIIFYLLSVRPFSMNNLMILVLVINLLTITLLFLFNIKRVATGALVIVLPLFSYFLIIRADVRPEMFSYLFTAIFIIILFKYREKYTNLIYLLIPLMIIWVNLHIYFAVGMATILLFLVEDFILNNGKINNKSKSLFIVFCLSFLASLLNPNFIKGAMYPFFFLNNYGITVQENLNFYELIKINKIQIFIVHIWIIVSSFLLLVLYRKKAFLIDWLIFIIFSVGALLAFRNFYIFIIVFFYPFAKLFGYFVNDLGKIIGKHVNKTQLNVLKTLCYFLILLTLIMPVALQYSEKPNIDFETQEHGKGAVDFYIENKIEGPFYNSFDLGQYLAYKLYPGDLVYVDARPEAYPEDFLRENYDKSLTNFEYFKDEEKKYKFNSFFIYPTYFTEQPLLVSLIQDEAYKLVYLDAHALIFVKNNNKNLEVIEKHEINMENYFLKGDEDLTTLTKYVLLFDGIGWKRVQWDAYRKLSSYENGICFLNSTLERRYRGSQQLKNITNLPDVECP